MTERLNWTELMSFFKNAKQSQTYRKVSAQITYFFLESSEDTLTCCSVTPESVQFSRSLMSDSATPWTAARQASPEYLTPECFSAFPANKDFLLFSHNTAITTWHCSSSLTTCPHNSFIVKGWVLICTASGCGLHGPLQSGAVPPQLS